MQPDPNGSAAAAPAPDTTAAPTPAPESGPTDAGAVGVESPNGDDAVESTPTPDDESEEAGDDEGTNDDDGQTEEQKKLSRRERQRLREQERIEREVAERLAAKEREATEAAERQKREAEVARAREQAAKEFAEYIGEDGESDRLRSEIDALNRKVRDEIANPQGVDLDSDAGLLAQITQREARLAEITRARGFQDKIAANVWNGIEAHVMSPLAWPEFADPATKQRYLQAEGGIAGALTVLKDVVAQSVEARKDAEIAEIKKSHASEVSTLREEMRGWRVRAGAEEVPDTTSGGQAGTGGGVYTRERLRQMMQTPAGMAEYRRNRAEIERQEAAGLIR